MTDRRNPWLILGMDYAGPAEEVVTHMAAKLRALRLLADPPFDRDDIVWASNKAKENGRDHFWRVPATSWPPDPPPDDAGLFRPPPAALKRSSVPVTAEDVTEAATAVIRSFLQQVADSHAKLSR